MNGARHPGRPGPAPVPDTAARVAEPGSYQGDRDQTRHAQTQGKYGCISRAGPLASPADTGKADKASLRSVRDFARKEWPLRGSTTSRSAIADRRHLSGGTSAGGHALWSQTGRGSATATVLIRSPYSCWLQCREWAPYSPQGTRYLRPLPGTSASLHPPVPGHPHFDNLLSIGDVQAPRTPHVRNWRGGVPTLARLSLPERRDRSRLPPVRGWPPGGRQDASWEPGRRARR